MRIVCVRHGETDWNKQGMIQGVTDTSLNENGLRAAREFADSLVEAGESFDKVYTSPLKRAYETGEVVAKTFDIPIFTKDGLKELCFGKFESLTWDQVRARYTGEFEYWNVHRKEASPPEGESYFHKSGDIIASMKEIIKESDENDEILVVSHSASLKALLFPIRHVDYNDMLKRFPMGNLQKIVLTDEDLREIMDYAS